VGHLPHPLCPLETDHENLVLGAVPHPQKLFITFHIFQCGYFQLYTKFNVVTLFQFEVTVGALKHNGQSTSIRNNSMMPSGEIVLDLEGHPSVHL
jgi:hypothetical protein